MSFKRDGDDLSLLLNLQKRRVSDLLVTHIPEDEALLMRNGKYACMVCSYRPVFDTLDMLAVHRKGNKHIRNLTHFLDQKRKDQESSAAKNLSHPLPKNAGKKTKILGDHHRLLKAKPYSSCMKRKPTIDILTGNQDKAATFSHLEESVSPASVEASSVLSSYLKSLPTKKNFAEVVNESRSSCHQEKLKNCVLTSSTPTNPEAVIDFKQPVYSSEDVKRKKECLKLLECGWKKDWRTGKWIKDESAEFDSDEEPPVDPS